MKFDRLVRCFYQTTQRSGFEIHVFSMIAGDAWVVYDPSGFLLKDGGRCLWICAQVDHDAIDELAKRRTHPFGTHLRLTNRCESIPYGEVTETRVAECRKALGSFFLSHKLDLMSLTKGELQEGIERLLREALAVS